MDKKTTPSFSSSSVKPRTSGGTISARNYRIVSQLPQGLQGIILG